MGSDRAYWSERQGKASVRSFTPEQVRRAFMSVVAVCDEADELQESFGYECVDDGFVPGSLGTAIEERLMIILGRDNLWPVSVFATDWDDDTLFDMMEFVYDHVSTGDSATARYHSFSNCGMHYARFNPNPARANYLTRVNEILRRMSPGFEMTESGEILRAVVDGTAPLLDSAPRLLEATQRAHVESAIVKYRARSSTATDRRDAVRDLADVLENLRADIKTHMPTKDEAALFEIANKFWIRHNRPGELRDYDHDAWWSWLFYLYLASIALVSHLAERQTPP